MVGLIIERLIEYELALSDLYRECAEKFTEHRDFWSELAEEEVIHADSIRKLTDEAMAEKADLNEKAFSIRPIEISIEYAKEIEDRVKRNKIDLLSILSLSYDIENSIIESEFHRVFTGRDNKVNDYIKLIHMESVNHRERIHVLKEKVLENTKTMERWD